VAAIQIAMALDTLSRKAVDLQNDVHRRVGSTMSTTLTEIASMPPEEFMEIINTYFVTPFMRCVNRVQISKYKNPIKRYSIISDEHRKDLEAVIDKNLSYLEKYSNLITSVDSGKPSLGSKKLLYAAEQFGGFLKLKSFYRAMLLPGGEQTTRFIQRTVLYGIINGLLNPDIYPPEFDALDTNGIIHDNTGKTMIDLLAHLLAVFRHEKLSYSMDGIRNTITMMAEQEKMGIIDEFDKMSADQKEVELTQKRLGIGRWGSERAAAVWKYNAKRYDIERGEREELGRKDFAEFIADEQGAATDPLQISAEGVDSGEGYDTVVNHGDDEGMAVEGTIQYRTGGQPLYLC
jgi:hypothetical protein